MPRSDPPLIGQSLTHVPDDLNELETAINEAQTKLEELKARVNTEAATAEELTKEVEELKTLADTSQKAIDAIAKTLREQLEAHDKGEFWKNAGVGFLFMVGGGLIALAITTYVPAFDCHH